MLAALSITLMFLGSIIWAFTYVAPLVSSVIMIIISDVANKRNALITYAAVSITKILYQFKILSTKSILKSVESKTLC